MQPTPDAGRFRTITLPAARTEELVDDAARPAAGRPRAADRRGRSALRARAAEPRARLRLQGAGRQDRRRGPAAGAQATSPTAITLDVFLPDMLGWTVLNQLKHDPATRHIPVQILTVEEERQYGLERGAFSFMNKPATTEGLEAALRPHQGVSPPAQQRKLLVVEDNPAEQMSIAELIGLDDVEITTAGSGAEALEALRARLVRLRGARPAPAGHLRLRAAGRDPAAAAAARDCRSSCSPAGSSPRTRTRSCGRRPRASCSRACSRPSACWTRRRCSCTGSSPTCRRPSSA